MKKKKKQLEDEEREKQPLLQRLNLLEAQRSDSLYQLPHGLETSVSEPSPNNYFLPKIKEPSQLILIDLFPRNKYHMIICIFF